MTRDAARGDPLLLVDDEPRLRDALAGLLRDHGYPVVAAGSVADALGVLRRDPVRALVTDVVMPGEDGLSLIRKVRRDPVWRRLPILALTGFGHLVAAEARAAGADLLLEKPVPGRLLVAAIHALIRPQRTAAR
jgi:CheY-like chemotaxis protein